MEIQLFFFVSTCSRYADAFEKLERLKLQGKADRDVVFVLCECCVSEQIYNMFYGLLAAKLSEYHKSYGLTFQYHIWDQIRGLSRFQETGRRNFALFVRDLLANNCVSLLVLKPVDFLADMGAELKQFVNLICSSLIADASMTSEAVLQQIFQGLSRKESEDIKLLREGVLLFLRFSLVFRKDQANEGNRAIIKRRLKLAKEALAHVRVVHKGVHQEEDEE
jgi:nucleolar MIF4G domain-containing protein 1